MKDKANLPITESAAEVERLNNAISELRLQLLAMTAEIGRLKTAVADLQQSVVVPYRQKQMEEMQKQMEEKEKNIQEMHRALCAYRAAFGLRNRLLQPWRAARQRLHAVLSPRLGRLWQHEPRPLVLPSFYQRPPVHMPAITIAVVTPSFMQAVFLERTLRSVLDQRYPHLEYFVADGGSTDNSAKIIARYGEYLTGWYSRPDGGQADAINTGFANVNGEIMAWLNSDDILLPGSLAYVAAYFERHAEVDVVYGHRFLIDENDCLVGRWMVPAHDNEVLSWADFVPQETMFWRRRIWEKVGAMVDTSFQFAIDWDLLLRFREAGARFVRLPRFIAGFRVHPRQKSTAMISQLGMQEMGRIRQRIHGRMPSDSDIHQAVQPYLRKHILTDIAWRFCRTLGCPY